MITVNSTLENIASSDFSESVYETISLVIGAKAAIQGLPAEARLNLEALKEYVHQLYQENPDSFTVILRVIIELDDLDVLEAYGTSYPVEVILVEYCPYNPQHCLSTVMINYEGDDGEIESRAIVGNIPIAPSATALVIQESIKHILLEMANHTEDQPFADLIGYDVCGIPKPEPEEDYQPALMPTGRLAGIRDLVSRLCKFPSYLKGIYSRH